MTILMRSRSGWLAATGFLFGLLLAGDRMWAQGEPLGGEQRMRQEAIHKVQEEMGPSFVPPSAAPPAVRASKIRRVTAQANTGLRCLPTCATDDGRFLALAGSNFQTLSPPELALAISVPAGSPSFTLGIFDGDGGEYQSDGFTANWDSGVTALFEYSLYEDPVANGTGTTPVDLAPGQPIILSDDMPDDDWIDFTVATAPSAQAPSGSYFYILKIRLLDESQTTLNAFKVRSNSTISGVTLHPVPRPFSYIAPWTTLSDISVIYPAFPLPAPTTYDGSFTFFIDVPASQSDFALWDGDFDHGNWNLIDQDTDDPDTPNAPFVPDWSTSEVAPEGVADGFGLGTGDPPDDDNPLDFGIYVVRSPAVRYVLHLPDGRDFDNPNPSGNREWEQFRISTAPFNASQMDYSTPTLPPGAYELRIQGVDMLNLNSLLLPFRVLCVDELGVVCQDVPRPYRIGDTVFEDRDANGSQGSGENGIPGVVLELRDFANVLITTTTTDAGGHYRFEVESGQYRVVVAPSNSAPGGALAGYTATTPTDRNDTVGTENVLTYDFGFQGTGSVGDRVWLDVNADGAPGGPGETGINGVKLELLDGSGNLIGSTVTSGDGNYSFVHLAPGTYTVRVDDTTLPAGLAPSSDLDGTGTADTATFQLAPGAQRTDVDFGYKGTASIGDRVWNDADGNGGQGGGEAGLNNVTVELLNSGGTVVRTTTTSGDGNYTFSGLLAGTYTVRVASGTLPPGFVPTYDLDGTGTPHTATLTLATGQSRPEVDFGYRTPPACTAATFKDTFTTASFSNNEGSASWSGAWVESDVAGAGVSSGNVTVGTPVSGYMIFRDSPDTGTQPSAARQANLSGFASATLTVDFHIRGVETDDAAVIEVSNNGGASYTVLETLTGLTGTYISSRTYDISAFKASNTRIRFRISANYGGEDDFFKIDQVRIDASCTAQTGSIGDRVWYDTDGDGAQDSGEPGLGGTTVELLNSSGTVIATTTTDANGIYTFANVAAGSYTVRVVASTLPAGGLAPTYDLDGTGTPHTTAVTLNTGQTRTDADFGYRGTRSLGDRVWNDTDGDGVQDSGEAGLNGVTVRLFLGSTEVASTVTAGSGNYSFTNLPDLTYTVKIDTATLPAGMAPTYDLDGTGTPHQANVTVSGNRTDVDFGYRTPPVSCTAGTFKDTFTTASFSNNEGSLSWSGAWVEYDTAGAGVGSGNVTVGTPVSGYMIFRDSPDTGTQPSAARQVNLSSFASATLTVDFHIRGVEADDAAVIEVSGNGGTSYTVLETLTGYTGTYISSRTYDISAFKAGNTRIRFRISANYGGDDDFFKVDQVRIDAGCTTASVGNRVWKDLDGGGDQDSGEPGINGATVQLLDSGGTVLATQTTSGDGNYLFSGLAGGTYKVKVVSSTLPSGLTPTYDLDGTGTAHTATFTLSAGQARTDVDFGYRTPPACTAGTFKDNFNTASFSNNDGTLSWAGAWVESDTAGAGVSSGNVTVGSPYSGYLFLRDYPDTGTQPSAARQACLTGFTSATLTFDFHARTAVDPDDAVVIEVSKNGGTSYTVLETLTGFTGTTSGSRTYNISAYIASNTRIRFRVSNNYGATDELFKVDTVRIDAACQ